MKYIKTYESFNRIDEGIFGDLLKSATGAFKNFLGGISAPFKTFKDDFKKGMKAVDIKNKITKAVDDAFKSASDNINKATTDAEIMQMVDGFNKQISDLRTSFDTQIKEVKESKVFEGAIQNGLIGARVMFDIIKNKLDTIKQEFDKKFIEAKDLAAKKQAAIDTIKKAVDEFKTTIQNEDVLKKKVEEYKTANKIVDTVDNKILTSYEANKPEELIGKTVRYKRDDYDDSKKPEEQEDMIASGEVKKIDKDIIYIFNTKLNKEIKKDIGDILVKLGDGGQEKEDEKIDIEVKVKKLKEEKPDSVDKLSKFIDFINTGDEKEVQEIVDKINKK